MSTEMFLLFWGVVLSNAGDVEDVLQSVLLSSDPKTLWTAIASVGSGRCAQDMNATLNALRRKELYALKLLDACAKFPEAILLGNMVFLGQYDECLSVSSANDQILGKYCLLNLNISGAGYGSALVNGFGTVAYQYAICVASSCSADDLNQGFTNAKLGDVLMAFDKQCIGAHDQNKLDAVAWVVAGGLLILLAILVASTTYEVWQRFHIRNEKPHELLAAFSVYRNGKVIFEVKDQSGHVDCLYGMRTISMFWVIYCHNGTVAFSSAVYNGLEIFADITNSKYLVATNGYVAVDSFFFLSGLLVAFVFFRDISRSGTYDVPRSYLSRYIRLTTPYATVLLVHIVLGKYLGDGPMQASWFATNQEKCEKWWWTGLLYVQNLVNPNEICLIQTWYLSADMQMYWLGPIFLYALYLRPKLGLVFVSLMIIASSLWTFGIAYAYKLSYTPFFDTTGDEDRLDNFPFWSRMSVWLVGLLLGFLISTLKARNIEVKLHLWVIISGWVVSLALCCACFFGMIWFLEHPDYTVSESAAFVSGHRVGWAFGLSWIVFACINGYGGPVNSFLSWGIFQPLGKLSYCMYLVHISVMDVVHGSQRVSFYSSVFTISLSFIYILVITILVAIPLSLLVEMPTMALDRYFLRSIKIYPYPIRKKTKREEKMSGVEESVSADIEFSSNRMAVS